MKGFQSTFTQADYDEIRRLIAAGKNAREVSEIIGRPRKTILTVARKHSLGEWASRTGPAANIPDDFEAQWQDKSVAKLAAHYGIGVATAQRWCALRGLRRKTSYRSAEHQAKKLPLKRSRDRAGHKGLVLIAVDRFTRDLSQAGQAADYLRRFGPVVRCDEKGKYKADGQHWRRGSTILTADEVIARAQRNGWNPDSWRQVA